MEELNKIFTEDLTSKTTFFYPCSGMDIKSITDLLDYKNNNVLKIDNFVLVDLNMDYDRETNDLGIPETHVLDREDWFFDNKLGYHKIKIMDKKEYSLYEIEDFVSNQLIQYKKIQRFKELVDLVKEPKAFRYKLQYNNHIFILYLIHYEASIISEKIRLSENNSVFGLILNRHIDGAFSDKSFFINKMIEFSPNYLVTEFDNSNFKDYKVLDQHGFIYYKNQIQNIGGINFIKIK